MSRFLLIVFTWFISFVILGLARARDHGASSSRSQGNKSRGKSLPVVGMSHSQSRIPLFLDIAEEDEEDYAIHDDEPLGQPVQRNAGDAREVDDMGEADDADQEKSGGEEVIDLGEADQEENSENDGDESDDGTGKKKKGRGKVKCHCLRVLLSIDILSFSAGKSQV